MPQLDTSRAGEFGVEGQNLYRELHLVNDTLTGTVAAGEKLKVLQPVMLPVSVDVVDRLFGEQITSEVFGHDVTVFHDGMAFAGHEGWNRNPDVSMALDVSPVVSSLKTGESFTGMMGVFAVLAAKFLFLVNTSSRFSTFVQRLSALLASESIFGFRIFFAANVRARTRAIKRPAFVFYQICVQVGTHHPKRFATFFAGEIYDFASWCNIWFSKTFGTSTVVAAKAPVVARIAEERLSAVFARFLNRHGFALQFGSRSILAVSVGDVK